MSTLITLLAALAPLAAAPLESPPSPQDRKVVRSGTGSGPAFVDFSDHLDRRTVRVVVGELGRLRDGKRTRIEDGKAHVGSGNSVSRISGTTYFAAKSKGRLALEAVLAPDSAAKAKKPRPVQLEFDVQLARMPDGSMRRQVLAGKLGQIDVDEGSHGLWILEAGGKRKRALRLVQFVPRTKGLAPKKFLDDAKDLVAINQRLRELKAALQGAKRKKERGVAAGEVRKGLEKILALPQVELRNPENDRWLQHLEPWLKRLREL